MSLEALTLTIAGLVAVITFGQWQSARAQLKQDLFDKRYEVYEKITGFLANIAISGKVEPGAEMAFLQETKRAYFLFAGEGDIKSLISEIYKKAVVLWSLQSELPSLSGDARSGNIEKQREIKNALESTLRTIETQFEKYLTLKE